MIETLAQLATILAALFAAVATFVAAWAAWEARKAAKASQAAVEAQVVYAAMSEYFQPTIAESLRTLRAWVDKHGNNFVKVWLEEFRKLEPEAVRVDDARRQVKGFFVRAARLRSAGHIGDEALHSLTYVHGLNLYYDVVVPLDLAKNPAVLRDTEQLLLNAVGRYQNLSPSVKGG